MRTLTAVIASFAAVGSANAAQIPFRIATATEVSSLTDPGVIATLLTQLQFGTGALIALQNPNHLTFTNVKRGNNSIADVYNVALYAGTKPVAHALTTTDDSALLDYDSNGNSAQAWATMSATAVPYAMVYVDGKAQGQATASWSARYIVPGSGDRDVYAQFTIPTIDLAGRFQDDAKGQSWARMRIDFLVDAYPAWTSETVRFNELHTTVINTATEMSVKTTEQVRIESFGYKLAYVAGVAPGDFHTSSSKTVTLWLGTYPAGKALDLIQLFQVEAKLDAKCFPDSPEFSCSGVSAKIGWDASTPPPILFSKPTM